MVIILVCAPEDLLDTGRPKDSIALDMPFLR